MEETPGIMQGSALPETSERSCCLTLVLYTAQSYMCIFTLWSQSLNFLVCGELEPCGKEHQQRGATLWNFVGSFCLPGCWGRELLASHAVVHFGCSSSELLLFELLVSLRIQCLRFGQRLLRPKVHSRSFRDTSSGQLLTNAGRTSSECWWHGDAWARRPTTGCFFTLGGFLEDDNSAQRKFEKV